VRAGGAGAGNREVVLEAAGRGIDAALAPSGILYTATVDGTWSRFKVCGNDTCRWAFYDRSKNRSAASAAPPAATR